jgi:hypothetical protein
MKKFEDEVFNVEQVKKKGPDYFLANIKDLIKRGKYTSMENGKSVHPSDKEILDRFYALTGFDKPKAEKEAKNV